MHTFFINTSKKSLDGYRVLFDVYYENRDLVTLECPISAWYDPEQGYTACVREMSEKIDGYVELNNAFNLILYIDLVENEAYSAIKRDAFHDKEREACQRAMRILFTHVISGTMVEELVNSGRRPENVLLMFGEEKKFATFGLNEAEAKKEDVMKNLFQFIGLPDAEQMKAIGQAVDKSDVEDKAAAFGAQIKTCKGKELIPGLFDGYQEALELWFDELTHNKKVEDANGLLFERINNINRMETDRIGVETVSCPYDSFASTVNKCVMALSELNLALYLLRCLEANSIYEYDGARDKSRVMEFHSYTVDEVAPLLKLKKTLFLQTASEIEDMAKSYADLKLAEAVSLFDHTKFGLDEHGDQDFEFTMRDVEGIEEDSLNQKGNTKELTIEQKTMQLLFKKDEFLPFREEIDPQIDDFASLATTPEQYIKRAMQVRKNHINYLKKLKTHVATVLSNYAGKSKENKTALLRMGGKRYAVPGKNDQRVLETLVSISDKAYDSMLHQYLEFCASRSVAVTDIEEQCNWFVSRIDQIRKSLKKIRIVSIGITAATCLLYLPYLLIQYRLIFQNPLSLCIGIGSVALPLVVLNSVCLAMARSQRRKFAKAWAEFKKRSDEVLQENSLAADKYDQLLAAVIPALRWVYEYRLDVRYCVECCDVADAKLEHHRRKLRDRARDIQNVLSDLEYIDDGKRPKVQDGNTDKIDFNAPFCTGKKNREFYTVIDAAFFQSERE
ncbi:MAG: hypothetical protein IJC88_04805 [Oscillospiraceae bacterium]|nr:hypothetical protein [Oscillospiraceae bacterium]